MTSKLHLDIIRSAYLETLFNPLSIFPDFKKTELRDQIREKLSHKLGQGVNKDDLENMVKEHANYCESMMGMISLAHLGMWPESQDMAQKEWALIISSKKPEKEDIESLQGSKDIKTKEILAALDTKYMILLFLWGAYHQAKIPTSIDNKEITRKLLYSIAAFEENSQILDPIRPLVMEYCKNMRKMITKPSSSPGSLSAAKEAFIKMWTGGGLGNKAGWLALVFLSAFIVSLIPYIALIIYLIVSLSTVGFAAFATVTWPALLIPLLIGGVIGVIYAIIVSSLAISTEIFFSKWLNYKKLLKEALSVIDALEPQEKLPQEKVNANDRSYTVADMKKALAAMREAMKDLPEKDKQIIENHIETPENKWHFETTIKEATKENPKKRCEIELEIVDKNNKKQPIKVKDINDVKNIVSFISKYREIFVKEYEQITKKNNDSVSYNDNHIIDNK